MVARVPLTAVDGIRSDNLAVHLFNIHLLLVKLIFFVPKMTNSRNRDKNSFFASIPLAYLSNESTPSQGCHLPH